MILTAISKSGVSIRLPEERWKHIIARHSALADQQSLVLVTITEPEIILDGNEGALMAIRTLEKGRVLVVVYKKSQTMMVSSLPLFPPVGSTH